MIIRCKYCDYDMELEPLGEIPKIEELEPWSKVFSHMFVHEDKNFDLDTPLNDCFNSIGE